MSATILTWPAVRIDHRCFAGPNNGGPRRQAHSTNRAFIHANGARPILFISWAYKDKPEMTAALAEQYTLAGTYLAACTVYASLFGKSPVGNTHTAGLPADVAAHLQQVAWETAQEYGAR